MQLNNRLLMMKGKTYFYMGNEHTIINFKIIDDTVHLVTNRSWLEMDIKKIETILRNDFIETTSPSKNNGSNGKSEMVVYEQVKQSNVLKTLVDNLTLLNENKIDTKKIKAMNDTVNTILNVAKTEIMVKKVKGR